MARSDPAAGGAGSVTQRTFEALLGLLTDAAGEARLAVAGEDGAPERPDVLVTPLSLARVGRSRRLGALLDLELAVAVEVAGDDVLPLTERLLLAAEASAHSRIDPLPADRTGFGFVVVLAISVALTEPSGPPVREPVVEVHPLQAITGTVVDPDGTALRGVEVSSSLTRQRTTTDEAGRFSLPGIAQPTTLTASRGPRRATLDVSDEATGLRIVLPAHEGS